MKKAGKFESGEIAAMLMFMLAAGIVLGEWVFPWLSTVLDHWITPWH